MASLHGFDWAPRETHWDQVLAQYKNFVASHGRTPRFRAPSQEERALADWFARQRRLMRSGQLAHRRVMELRALAQTPLTDTHEQ
ncbi:MAG: helicase associated domain-containing protein [Microbacterium sp.]|nr:helicase associated domain-containing protein [Microbacterium sp.]